LNPNFPQGLTGAGVSGHRPGDSVADMAHALADGYHGPPPLTVARGFTQWTLDPWMLALVLLLGAAYLAGVVRGRDRGPGAAAQPWPWTRVANFGLGLAIVVIATMGSFGAYANVLFFMRAFQTILLLMLAPLFLTLGRPLTLFIEVFPRAGQRLERAVRSKVARVLTFPAITTLALIAVPFVMYFTGWYTAVFHSVTVREVTFLALMLPGYVFFWTLLRVDPVPKVYSYGVSLWITAFEVVGDAFLGLAVIADTGLIGSAYYHALARPWGLSLRTDQIVGGGTLWIFGDLVGLPFLVAQLIQFIREDEAEAAEIDAELDAREAARDAARAARKAAAIVAEGRRPARDATPPGIPQSTENADVTSDPASPQTADTTAAEADSEVDDPERPWWESDPRFQERFRQV
jgi:cytochrome c oxidase assembly factor CtaG